MADIALFHSVLGVRPGVQDAAARLRAAGHAVTMVDQYDGRVFDDYEEAAGFAEVIGYPALMQRALEGVGGLPDGFVAIGFSNGAGMAEFVATQRQVGGVVLASGTLPLAMIDVLAWPADTPVQVHYALDDPNRRQEWIDSLVGSVQAAGAPVEVFDYPGRGHLFTDASLPDEHDPSAAELLWKRVLAFCADR
ncbi:MAG: dienelactone hydrolase family protein [Actinomycetota bacterium]|nr:dienelactone hydrolase family protein [Actinomycetota bacterium]